MRRAIDEAFRATASAPFALHAELLREILGNPFRAARAERPRPGAEGGRVVGVARSIYEGRRFEDLPVSKTRGSLTHEELPAVEVTSDFVVKIRLDLVSRYQRVGILGFLRHVRFTEIA